jgi:hypothetical protein
LAEAFGLVIARPAEPAAASGEALAEGVGVLARGEAGPELDEADGAEATGETPDALGRPLAPVSVEPDGAASQ